MCGVLREKGVPLQPVAIKQMLHTDQKAREDFLNEIKLLKHVSLDANVLQYYGATIKDDYLWLVTEYMQVRGPHAISGNYGLCCERWRCGGAATVWHSIYVLNRLVAPWLLWEIEHTQ